MSIENFLDQNPFSLNLKEKKDFFYKYFKVLNNFHLKNSKEFKLLSSKVNLKKNNFTFVPVSLFKTHNLISINKNEIFKTLLSSGTSNKGNSKIFLDKKTSVLQTKILSKIMQSILGSSRLPMIILDKKPTDLDRLKFNAKIAAIYGFSIFGKDHFYILNKNNEIDYLGLENYLNKYKKIFIFGFTYQVYDILFKKFNLKKINNNFSNSILLHGGGWKKMEEEKIDNKLFKKKLKNKTKISKIFNYYGMIEQTGTIFLECEKCGCFKTSIFSDVFIRDDKLNISPPNKKGLIQLLSLLPHSYPGHNILTEDIGEIVDSNDCECTKSGKRFIVHGRAPESEIRGCSDI